MLIKDLILKKVEAIEIDLSNRYDQLDSLGIFTGACGSLVFYYYLFRLTKEEKYQEKFYDLLDNIYDRINTDNYPNTYCDGLAGIALVIDYFSKKGMIAIEDVNETLAIFDDLMVEAATISIHTLEEYDFLHGEFGALFYLCERMKENPLIETDVIELFEIAAKTLQGDIALNGKFAQEVHQGNCGMAHGNMSYIVIFSKFLEKVPENRAVKEAIVALVAHQLSFKSTDSTSYSLFPSIVNDTDNILYNAVLGWCYGDQPIAIGLYIAGTVLKDQTILDQAYEIALHTSKRNTVLLSSKTELTDAGLCHGMASVAHNNKLLYAWTNEQVFYDNYLFFTEKVMERGNHPATASGFRRYFGDDKHEDILGLLDGTMGIGVFLISTLLEEDTDWERFFLLK